MNQILYGFHLLIGRFDMYKPKKHSLLAQKVMNLVLMMYTASFMVFLTMILGQIGAGSLLNNKWIFVIIVFIITCIEDYYLFERNNNAEKYYQNYLHLDKNSVVKWEIAAVVFSLGAIIFLCLAMGLVHNQGCFFD